MKRVRLYCSENNSKDIDLYMFSANPLSPKYFVAVIGWIFEYKICWQILTGWYTSKPPPNLLPYWILLCLALMLYLLKVQISPLLLCFCLGDPCFCATAANTDSNSVPHKGSESLHADNSTLNFLYIDWQTLLLDLGLPVQLCSCGFALWGCDSRLYPDNTVLLPAQK